jgi:ferredoxin-type protein NapH
VVDITKLGNDAIAAKGWLKAHRFLVLRRVSQLGILALFLSGPLLGLWIVKGNLASSLTLEILPLTDPHLLLQSMLSGVVPQTAALIGALIVALFYMIVGGRAFCAWVCPVNMVTDLAAWLRRKLGLRASSRGSRSTRYWMLGLTLVLPLATSGGIVWELVNPVSVLFRGIVFGIGTGWLVITGVFLFDLLLVKDGWCGHLCPVGAFYNLLGSKSLIRVSAIRRRACNDCAECFLVCPEPHVIKPALQGAAEGLGPVILASDCTNCGRCIDICAKDVFSFGSRRAREIVAPGTEGENDPGVRTRSPNQPSSSL